MRESAFEKYVSYWEEIANAHPEIKSFYYLDEDEIITGVLRSKVQYPCLFLEYMEPRPSDNSVNAPLEIVSGLGILTGCPANNEIKIKEALIKNEKIIIDIVSKLRKDREEGTIYMNSNSLSWSKVGKVFIDNCYGWRLDFKYQQWIDLTYYPQNWITTL